MSKITVDGNTAASRMAYKFSEVCCIYPITPSSPMAELCDEASSKGEKNLFNKEVRVVEMQSEAGAAGALHGSLVMGALSTTFTSSQGLLLMIPNMYKMAGELLPAVFHVSARAIASHALSIFGDHTDVMACRGTGFNMICSNSVQEAQDMAVIAHISALKSSLPFLHFFDGFRTSHEIQKIEDINNDILLKLLPKEKIEEFRKRGLNSSSPHQQGTAQNPDIFFQNREACNVYYNKVFDIVEESFSDFYKLTNRKYSAFEYVGSKDAKNLIIMMGSGAETCEEYLKVTNEKDVALIKVRLYRPFNAKALLDIIPKSVKKICVLDRTKESGAIYEPLALDILSATNGKYKFIAGRYGLGGKEFNPECVHAVIENLKSKQSKTHFTVGIVDDVTNYSLPLSNIEYEIPCKQMKFFGLGSDGTVSANKNSIKIIGGATDKYVQGYFEYDSKKSGSLTQSHLRISDEPIKSTYVINKADFIAIHNFSFLTRYNCLETLKPNGVVLLNTVLNKDELDAGLPNIFKKEILERHAKLYIINAAKIAKEVGLGNKINVIMQSAFFKVSNIIDFELAKKQMKEAAYKTYGKKGDAVVQSNYNGIDKGAEEIIYIDKYNFSFKPEKQSKQTTSKYYLEFIKPIEELKGNKLPVSAFSADGHVPTNTSKFEKRGIALETPLWHSENCIQCGRCVLACPHAAITPILCEEDELKQAPDGFITVKAIATNGLRYRIQISPLDCTGCGVCSNVCPSKEKALTMQLASKDFDEQKECYNYSKTIKQTKAPWPKTMMKGLQFEKPYFEFSGACAGCGETPYIKLATMLFGERMIIANATGCSSIYGGNAPSCPYSKNEKGEGPAWANSLFEDNAEFGMGMSFAKEVLNKEKESIWIIGGDGWAYDIGYGGLDHLLASKENVNILVLDSEVYSNTGGQASKSTPKGSWAKFASGGKKTKKKNLALMAMSYQNAYVASVSLGADYNQCIKAFREAEAFDGPSLIIAFSPCVNHGYNLARSQEEEKRAVESGYWSLFRYSPETGVIFDSDEPTMSYKEFIMGETRYSSLFKANPEVAEELYKESEREARERIEAIKKYIKNNE